MCILIHFKEFFYKQINKDPVIIGQLVKSSSAQLQFEECRLPAQNDTCLSIGEISYLKHRKSTILRKIRRRVVRRMLLYTKARELMLERKKRSVD